MAHTRLPRLWACVRLGPAQHAMVMRHTSIGMAVLALTIGRLAWRFTHAPAAVAVDWRQVREAHDCGHPRGAVWTAVGTADHGLAFIFRSEAHHQGVVGHLPVK
jgi:hypothetical protein